jgi:glyoxylase-like metal-dependent hydrolase (beta-lactamase superfamily II)
LTGILKGDKPNVVIDPGHIVNEAREDCLGSLEAAMVSDGIKIEDTGLIINTHSHPDHCEANDAVAQKSGASITMSEEENKFRLTTGLQMYELFDMEPPHFTPLFYLKEGSLDLGKDGFKVSVILTPGHSPGSVCLYLEKEKILITGDVIFYMSVGRTDFPGGDTTLLEKSIQKLSLLDVEYLVPGHNTEPKGVIRGKQQIQHNFEAVRMFF